jgi:Uma2 family endonuclease
MVAQPTRSTSEEAYLAFERASATKHEYYAGQVYAMTGAKEPHNLIAGNAHASLHRQLRQRPGRVYQSDMRVKVIRTGLNTYPDVVVLCGQPQFTDTIDDTVMNPIVIVEVLSSSTERYDRGMKFEHYRMIETLRAYVLIAQDHQHIECYTRQDNGQWLFQEASEPEQQIVLNPIACTLTISDIYEKVDLEQDDLRLPGDMLPL